MRFVREDRNQSRYRSGFLWLPKRIGHETRWLERAEWEERYGYESWYAWDWVDDEPRYTLTEAGRKHLAGGK